MIELIDTHCHIQFLDYGLDPEEVIANAKADGVTKMIAVGCTLPDSKAAISFARDHEGAWASVGLHPHEASRYVHDHHALQQFHDLAGKPKVVAVGETGLDYFYGHSSKEDQEKMLRFQLDVAIERDLPLIFHIRDPQKQNKLATGQAFDDFRKIVVDYPGIRGVVHSFSASTKELNEVINRGLYVGLNGIMTFAKDEVQLEAAKAVPLERLVLETDAPFLTPTPFRDKICEPKHVRVTAEFLAKLRGESLEELARATTRNAAELFNLKG